MPDERLSHEDRYAIKAIMAEKDVNWTTALREFNSSKEELKEKGNEVSDPQKNENPSPQIEAPNLDAPAEAEAESVNNSFKDDPEKIRQWIAYLRTRETKKATDEIETWEGRLQELGEAVPR